MLVNSLTLRSRMTAAPLAVFASLLGSVLLTACGGPSVSTDWDTTVEFASLQTWNWIPMDQGSGAGDFIDGRIRSAVEAALSEKGMRMVDLNRADVGIGFQITSEEETSIQTTTTGYGGYGGGYGRGRRGRGWSGGGGMSTSRTTEISTTVGTLLIEVFDTSSQDLIWQSVAEGTVKESESPEESQSRIDAVVVKALANFPPS